VINCTLSINVSKEMKVYDSCCNIVKALKDIVI